MNIVLIGLNHITAPVELRERLAMSGMEPGDIYQGLQGVEALRESVFFFHLQPGRSPGDLTGRDIRSGRWHQGLLGVRLRGVGSGV